MGNQQSLAAGEIAQQSSSSVSRVDSKAEPLESYLKEKQRDDHLKNLGFKRSKSLRRSISKRLSKRRRKREAAAAAASAADQADSGGAQTVPEPAVQSEKEIAVAKPSEDTKDQSQKVIKVEYPEPKKRQKPIVGNIEPLPSHVQVWTIEN